MSPSCLSPWRPSGGAGLTGTQKVAGEVLLRGEEADEGPRPERDAATCPRFCMKNTSSREDPERWLRSAASPLQLTPRAATPRLTPMDAACRQPLVGAGLTVVNELVAGRLPGAATSSERWTSCPNHPVDWGVHPIRVGRPCGTPPSRRRNGPSTSGGLPVCPTDRFRCWVNSQTLNRRAAVVGRPHVHPRQLPRFIEDFDAGDRGAGTARPAVPGGRPGRPGGLDGLGGTTYLFRTGAPERRSVA